MSIRFIGNNIVEVDTISEAISWEHRKGKEAKPRGRPRKFQSNLVDGSPWVRFCSDIGSPDCVRMRKILALVKGRGDEVTESYISDTNELPDLLKRTSDKFNVKELSADKAYLSNVNLMTVEAFGTQPFIPFKSDSQGKGSPAWERLWKLFWFKQDEFSVHYHQRSNVESTFSALKRKFGGSVKSKDAIAQYNEVLCKCLAYNITVVIHEMFELGIQPEFSSRERNSVH